MNPKYEIDECLNKVKGNTFYEVFRNGMSHGFFITKEKAADYIAAYNSALDDPCVGIEGMSR